LTSDIDISTLATMKTSHITPGDWKVENYDGLTTQVWAGDNLVAETFNENLTPEAMEANAKAIAALPKLIAALVEASRDLVANHVVDSVLYAKQHPHANKLNEPQSLAKIRAALADAGIE
jgi:hypothetical protein